MNDIKPYESNQQVFDIVCKHLLTQRRKSRNQTTCMYLADNGDKCAVGCLIPKELYSREYEGFLVSQIISMYPALTELFSKINPCILTSLQSTHDIREVYEWEEDLMCIGRTYSLTFPEIGG